MKLKHIALSIGTLATFTTPSILVSCSLIRINLSEDDEFKNSIIKWITESFKGIVEKMFYDAKTFKTAFTKLNNDELSFEMSDDDYLNIMKNISNVDEYVPGKFSFMIEEVSPRFSTSDLKAVLGNEKIVVKAFQIINSPLKKQVIQKTNPEKNSWKKISEVLQKFDLESLKNWPEESSIIIISIDKNLKAYGYLATIDKFDGELFISPPKYELQTITLKSA